VENIARTAGTSRVTFYAHFSDKQDVIRELAQNTLQTAVALYERFGTLADWNLITITDWMGQVFEAWERNTNTTSAVIEEMPQEFKVDFLPALELRIDALMSGNSLWNRFDPEEGRRRAALLLFQMERCIYARPQGYPGGERDALLSTLVDIWLATLKVSR
jgi:AcrR family transcriptional regulator